jgi:PUA-like domain
MAFAGFVTGAAPLKAPGGAPALGVCTLAARSAAFQGGRVAAAAMANVSVSKTTMSASAPPLPIAVSDLVENMVPEQARAAKVAEAATLEAVTVSDVDMQWIHVLGEGWASPLRGLMREDEYLQTLHFNAIRMPDGSVTNMSVPIVLALSEEDKSRV